MADSDAGPDIYDDLFGDDSAGTAPIPAIPRVEQDDKTSKKNKKDWEPDKHDQTEKITRDKIMMM